MKNWLVPSIEELNIAETSYGGKVINDFDAVYVNADGQWEASFVARS